MTNVMRSQYRNLDDLEIQRMNRFKEIGENFYSEILRLENENGASRELALARTKIEEAVMWAVKHITG